MRADKAVSAAAAKVSDAALASHGLDRGSIPALDLTVRNVPALSQDTHNYLRPWLLYTGPRACTGGPQGQVPVLWRSAGSPATAHVQPAIQDTRWTSGAFQQR